VPIQVAGFVYAAVSWFRRGIKTLTLGKAHTKHSPMTGYFYDHHQRVARKQINTTGIIIIALTAWLGHRLQRQELDGEGRNSQVIAAARLKLSASTDSANPDGVQRLNLQRTPRPLGEIMTLPSVFCLVPHP
jgi:hypothetical protein